MGSNAHHLLAQLAASTAAQTPVVVLDLDSTLIDTGPRHKAILDAFVHEQAPHLADVADGIVADDIGWAVTSHLARAGVGEAELEAYEAFWRPRFFDGAWCVHDQATAGAVNYVQRLLELGAIVYYLTARPAPSMGPQTVESLVRLGFPVLRGRCPLHMKPSAALPDHRFKRAAIREPACLGEVVATFDNEPGHCNTFRQAYPRARHFLVGSVHRPDAPEPHPAIETTRDFRSA